MTSAPRPFDPPQLEATASMVRGMSLGLACLSIVLLVFVVGLETVLPVAPGNAVRDGIGLGMVAVGSWALFAVAASVRSRSRSRPGRPDAGAAFGWTVALMVVFGGGSILTAFALDIALETSVLAIATPAAVVLCIVVPGVYIAFAARGVQRAARGVPPHPADPSAASAAGTADWLHPADPAWAGNPPHPAHPLPPPPGAFLTVQQAEAALDLAVFPACAVTASPEHIDAAAMLLDQQLRTADYRPAEPRTPTPSVRLFERGPGRRALALAADVLVQGGGGDFTLALRVLLERTSPTELLVSVHGVDTTLRARFDPEAEFGDTLDTVRSSIPGVQVSPWFGASSLPPHLASSPSGFRHLV
ncbi:hypothetical protein [Herbiconiux liukaitaii]|uniref:hypothetical protein n=1 Tax=Herbiconiux liukaitaii TaxID=3342799 RepID=UPI0035B88619